MTHVPTFNNSYLLFGILPVCGSSFIRCDVRYFLLVMVQSSGNHEAGLLCESVVIIGNRCNDLRMVQVLLLRPSKASINCCKIKDQLSLAHLFVIIDQVFLCIGHAAILTTIIQRESKRIVFVFRGWSATRGLVFCCTGTMYSYRFVATRVLELVLRVHILSGTQQSCKLLFGKAQSCFHHHTNLLTDTSSSVGGRTKQTPASYSRASY
jgi:hypothetical protein